MKAAYLHVGRAGWVQVLLAAGVIGMPQVVAGGDLEAYDVAPCGGDGIVELADVIGILQAYSSVYACTCPGGGGGWALTGNGGTNAATNFVGTTDNVA